APVLSRACCALAAASPDPDLRPLAPAQGPARDAAIPSQGARGTPQQGRTMTAAARGLFLPGLCTLVALAILLGLGFWQLDRLEWKETLIAGVEARTKGPAVPLPPESEWPKHNAENDEYRRVTAAGRFHH